MIIDARQDAQGSQVDCDVCVIGAGAAGLTVALELLRSRRSICLLEAGGIGRSQAAQSMLEGQTADESYPPLHTVRLAGLGGSMGVWAGWCRPLDPIDFEARESTSRDGWPFGIGELAPWYRRAHELLDLGPYDYDPESWERSCGARALRPGGADFRSILFRRSAINLGRSRRPAIERSADLRLLLHAHALRLRYSPDGRAVSLVEAATSNGRRFGIRARAVVLAAGAIETARILLLSEEKPGSLGNRHGLVGRYFMEHGYDDSQCFVPADPGVSLRFYHAARVAQGDGRRVARGALAPSAGALRRESLLNCALSLRPAYESDPIFADPRVRSALELWDMLRSRAVPDRLLRSAMHGLSAPGVLGRALWRRLAGPIRGIRRLRVLTLFECAPDSRNRVVLGSARDALGRPVARLDWKLRDADRQSVARVYQLFDAGLRAAGLGHLEPREGSPARPGSDRQAIGQHHMGTTRMHVDPARGVVDADCRVHGVENLYAAGGSVFATGGFANPTLTIVALAARLAAHLERQLDPGR